ncbi:unnamed protein product, partial [Brenthis ino]
MVVQGVVGKLGAVFIIIPQPRKHHVCNDRLVRLRNLYIIGFSQFFPLLLTRWMAAHGGVIHLFTYTTLHYTIQHIHQAMHP